MRVFGGLIFSNVCVFDGLILKRSSNVVSSYGNSSADGRYQVHPVRRRFYARRRRLERAANVDDGIPRRCEASEASSASTPDSGCKREERTRRRNRAAPQHRLIGANAVAACRWRSSSGCLPPGVPAAVRKQQGAGALRDEPLGFRLAVPQHGCATTRFTH